jgi:hypothetical protein
MELPKPNETNFTPPPAGAHAAICYRFIDLGTHEGEYMGVKNYKRKVMLSWELPGELMDDGKPFSITQRYTWSMHEKAVLRKDLQSWRGKAFTDDDFSGPTRFNIKNVLGKPCLVNVVHATKDGTVYGNIAGITPLPKGMPVPQPVNEIVYFSLDAPLFNAAVLDSFSDKLKTFIKGSPEYAAVIAPKGDPGATGPDDYSGAFSHDDSDIPF